MTRSALPPRDGGWWAARSRVPARCEWCGATFADPLPAVMAYRPELDHGGYSERTHPGWSRRGWLAWYEHAACGPTLVVVDDAAVAAVGRRARWRALR